jgi:hypothetical protein
VPGIEPRGVFGLRHRSLAAPVDGSASQMAHGFGRSTSAESGAPPDPGARMNAMREPSAFQRGETSRDVDGATHRIGVESFA